MPPEHRTGPLGEGAGSTSNVGDGGQQQSTAHHDVPRVTVTILARRRDQAVAA